MKVQLQFHEIAIKCLSLQLQLQVKRRSDEWLFEAFLWLTLMIWNTVCSLPSKLSLEIIRHVGTNDLKHYSPRVVAELIVVLGNLVFASSPDIKVTISALTQRYDEEYNKNCNKVIKTFCIQNG